jgi:predicted MFS family arabinose efflux permease
MLAAALLTIVSFPALFLGTVAGFIASALLVVAARLPARAKADPGRFWAEVTKSVRIYTRTPRLRGLMVMEAAVAAAGAMVYVNTVVLVQARLGLGEEVVALAFAGFGAGSMLAAFLLPHILDRLADRPVMFGGAALMVAGVPLLGSLAALIALWALIGFGFSLTQTPNRSDHQPLSARGRPGRGVRRAIRPVSRLLAGRLSASRLDRRGSGSVCGGAGARGDRSSGPHRCAAPLAHER